MVKFPFSHTDSLKGISKSGGWSSKSWLTPSFKFWPPNEGSLYSSSFYFSCFWIINEFRIMKDWELLGNALDFQGELFSEMLHFKFCSGMSTFRGNIPEDPYVRPKFLSKFYLTQLLSSSCFCSVSDNGDFCSSTSQPPHPFFPFSDFFFFPFDSSVKLRGFANSFESWSNCSLLIFWDAWWPRED